MTAASREGARIGRRLVGIAVAATVVLALVALAATVALMDDGPGAEMRTQVVELNAARAELRGGEGAADAALVRAQEALRAAAGVKGGLPIALVWALAALGAAVVWGVVAYLHVSVVRPFMRLESFAQDVAAGNLDTPLAYERSNPFGRFTWAFDNMRAEIKRARAAEAEAVEQGKTAVAALSHDIKTPIASIRAYSEALELGLARNDAEREGYARTIARKCDEVTSLTDDLFLHALADLDRIRVSCEDAPIARTIRQAVADFGVAGNVALGRLDEARVAHDPKRLEQALENLLANAARRGRGGGGRPRHRRARLPGDRARPWARHPARGPPVRHRAFLPRLERARSSRCRPRPVHRALPGRADGRRPAAGGCRPRAQGRSGIPPRTLRTP